MFFLEVLYRVVGIFGGVVAGLNGAVALAERCKSYIERRKAETEKDPSTSLPASDGSDGDRSNDH